jgi:hypothetical protein
MFPVPTVAQLADFTGRPASSFTGYATATLIQASIMFTTLTEQTDASSLTSDDAILATYGIMAMADYIYLRQPYQQAIAAPFMNETIGSYSYGKAIQEMARNAQAAEVLSEATGVTFFDLAVRMLAKRTRAGGVFSGGITVFERTTSRLDPDDGGGRLGVRFDGAGLFLECVDANYTQWVVRGPDEHNLIDWQFFDMNTEVFPMDPGIG